MEEPSRLLTIRFGTVAPSGKPQNEIPQFHYSTSHPNRNLDPPPPPPQKKKKTRRMETLYNRNLFMGEWVWLVSVSMGGGEHKYYSYWGGWEHWFTSTYINLLLPMPFNTVTVTLGFPMVFEPKK